VRAEGVQSVLEAARAARGLRCVPAMCMRFWPGWDWVRERVRDGSLGRVRAVALERMGAGPTWGAEFYRDEERCGGALVDLHVHDTDFLCWLFGPPREVTSVGSARHVTTLYRWGEPGANGVDARGAGLAAGAPVSAEGAWGLPQAAGFRMRFRVAFERAWAEFDLARERPLRVFGEDGAALEGAPTGSGEDGLSAYDLQVRHFVGLCLGREREARASIEDALIAARVLDAERESLRTACAVAVGV
jgi:predicted dehydrogenase